MKAGAVVLAAAVVTPVGLLVLLGAGFASAASDSGTGADPNAAKGAPAASDVRGGGGCSVANPYGTRGCVTPALAGVMAHPCCAPGPPART